LLLVILNLLVKPIWIFAIDRQVQNLTGFSAYGQYFALLNLCIILNFLLDLGISAYFNREVAARQVNGITLFSDALNGKLWLSLLFSGVVVTVAYISGIREFRLLLMLIFMQIGSSILLFVRSYLTATQHYRQDAIISITDKFIVIIIVGTVILFPGLTGPITIFRFVAIQVSAIGLSIALGIFLLFRNVEKFTIRPFRGFRKEILFSSLPFAINIFLMTLMSRSDGFLLERMHRDGAAEAGVYAAGFRLLDAFNMVGFLMTGFLLPFISRNWPNLNRFSPVLLACRHLLILGSLVVAAFALAAPQYITRLLYNREDTYLINIIQTILLALPALSLVHIYGTTLTATRNIQTFIRISLFFSVTSVLLNIFFIPQFGAKACAIIAVIIQSLYAITIIYFARRKTGIGLWLSFGPVYLAAGILCFAVIRVTAKLDGPVLLSAIIAATGITLLFMYKSGISFQQIKKLLIEK